MNIFTLSTVLIMAVLPMAGAASAAPARIASLSDHIDGPVRVALDSQGNIYLAQSTKNTVSIYNSEGAYQRSFSVPYPVGIAVDASGTIFVGSGASGKRDGQKNAVYIFTGNLVQSGALGIGAGEFTYPNDIAVDTDGKVYVTDTLNHVVKVFDRVAGTSFSIGGPGSTSGLFKRPTAVAVNDAAGEVYVADYPVITTTSGASDGARIQVFNKNGGFLRSFGQFGNLIGQISSPVGIAIDSAGLLYVTDSFQNVVHILNSSDGSPAGSGGLYDPAKPLYNPMGVAVSKNGLVYVASFRGEGNKGRVDVYALDGHVSMAVNPTSLTFLGTQYAGNPDPQTVVIANAGTGTLHWSATADQNWINLGKQAAIGPRSAGGLAVGVDISSFTRGLYKGSITIDSGFGQKQVVGVTVSVVQPPILNISNGWLTFVAKKGTTPAAQGIKLGIDNLTGPITWGIASDSPSWLTVFPSSGTISSAALTGAASVSVNTAGMPVGSHSGVLTVSAPGAIGTGGKIAVNLTITPSTKIKVNTNRPDAKFSVTGPAEYKGSGSDWSMENVPAGDYTVTFDAVNGYKKPLPQAKTLAADGEAAFKGNYASWQELAAKRNIIVAKGPAQKNDSLVKAYKNNGAPVAFDLVALSTRYGANVAAGDVDNDGTAELIVGTGDGHHNPATVRIFRADKTLFAEFVPFGTLHGVHVGAADLDGDGSAEIIVSAGDADNAARLAVFAYDGKQNTIAATGIDIKAYASASGANIAVADLDGKGKPVIVTAPGLGKHNPALVKIWKIATSEKLGGWSAELLKEISLGGEGQEGASVAAGDVDGDGRDEIVAGTGGEHAAVMIVRADGSQSKFKVRDRNGVNVAAADLDGDGKAEIITASGQGNADHGESDNEKDKSGDGASRKKDDERGAVRIYGASGAVHFTLTPFEDAKEGINVAVGDLGL